MGSICPCLKKKVKPSEISEGLINDKVSSLEEGKTTDEYDFSNKEAKSAKVIPIRNENDKISYPKKVSVSDFSFLKVPPLFTVFDVILGFGEGIVWKSAFG